MGHSNDGSSSLRSCQLVQAGFEPGSHSTSCSQNEGMSCGGLLSPTLHGSRGAHISKGISGGSDCTIDIFVKAQVPLSRGNPWWRQLYRQPPRGQDATIRTASGGVRNFTDNPFRGHHDLLEPSSVPMPHIYR